MTVSGRTSKCGKRIKVRFVDAPFKNCVYFIGFEQLSINSCDFLSELYPIMHCLVLLLLISCDASLGYYNKGYESHNLIEREEPANEHEG